VQIKMPITGSSPPTGALFFQEDGTIHLHLSATASEQDREAMHMTTDYFQYAMQREDWLEEFFQTSASELEDMPRSTENHHFSKDDLRVIKGGNHEERSGADD
jgi:hypothetical protein